MARGLELVVDDCKRHYSGIFRVGSLNATFLLDTEGTAELDKRAKLSRWEKFLAISFLSIGDIKKIVGPPA